MAFHCMLFNFLSTWMPFSSEALNRVCCVHLFGRIFDADNHHRLFRFGLSSQNDANHMHRRAFSLWQKASAYSNDLGRIFNFPPNSVSIFFSPIQIISALRSSELRFCQSHFIYIKHSVWQLSIYIEIYLKKIWHSNLKHYCCYSPIRHAIPNPWIRMKEIYFVLCQINCIIIA